MPRIKKPAGTAADSRNGRRFELAVVAESSLDWFQLPERRPEWEPEARQALEALRVDPVSTLITPVDAPVILRWVDSLDRAARALRRADRKPVTFGSQGQMVEHPSYGTAARALGEAAKCEQQLGVGAYNRARLGVESAHAEASLMDLNKRLEDARAARGVRRDPRAVG